MLSLRQLEVLRAVVRLRTTVGAAREIGMSQPAVSQAIRAMEAGLGLPLFQRVGGRLLPTEQATQLLERAEPLFLVFQGVRQEAADLRAGRAGRLRVTATAELAEALLPRVLARFVPAHPRVALSLEVRPMREMLDAVEAGAAHLGLGFEPDARPGLVLRPLARFGMVCAVPAASPLARRDTLAPRDLVAACRDGPTMLIAPPEGTRLRTLLGEAFRAAGQPFVPQAEVRFMTLGLRLVEQGLGVAVVDPLSAAGVHPDRVAQRPFLPAIPIGLHAVLAREARQSRLVEAFLRHLRAVLSGMGLPACLPSGP